MGFVTASEIVFYGSQERVTWSGYKLKTVDAFDALLKGTVSRRIFDVDHSAPFQEELEALATTEMASDALGRILGADVAPRDWEIGEAIAECLLAEILDAEWPWNMERDKRTPRANLQGADLVGFCKIEGRVWLLVGEVKTSSDARTPPQVMTGRTGAIHQLEQILANPAIQRSLLSWLFARCKTAPFADYWRAAARTFLETDGKALVLAGVLVLTTQPTEADLSGRGRHLCGVTVDPTKVHLSAIYIPRASSEWGVVLNGGGAQ